MTLSYTTAQKLFEHGFPQNPNGGNSVYKNGELTQFPYSLSAKDELVIIPSFEELLEACGDGISGLVRGWDGKWWAANAQNQTEPQDTPLEAVALLFCALNPKGV
jgi:hypothetical protein